MALIPLGGVGLQQAYNDVTGALHMVRITGAPGSETVTDLGAISSAIAVGDIEIGAVELKDAATVLRANVRQADAAVPGDDALVVADPNMLVALNTLLGLAAYNVLAGPNELTVDATATGQTLAVLLGGALNVNLRRLTLVVQGTVSWAAGAAAIGVNELAPGVYTLDVDKTVADTFKFIAPANVAMSLIQEG